MQLLDSAQTQLFPKATNRLLDVLEDIVHKVEIKSDLSIRHSDYKPLELPEAAVTRLQKMPKQMQQKYLSLQLRNFLYGIYYSGAMKTTLALGEERNDLPLKLENNTVLGVNVGFYERLHKSNHGTGYFDPDWSVLKEKTDKSLVVTKEGLRLHIERDKHLPPDQQVAVPGDVVAIRMPKNLVQKGFYMAVGNVGTNLLNDSKAHSVTVRVYFHLPPEGAVAVMGSLTRLLNEKVIPFSFKVLYNPNDYERYDSGVLYFDQRNYEAVREVLQIVYRHEPHFKSDIPLFTKQLAPGLGLAEEPDQKFAQQESFGMNRCQILANGLLEACHQGDNSQGGRIKAIHQQFSLLNIDLNCPYLNANSKDIYTPLT